MSVSSIDQGSKANDMLKAMGWKPGEGIGKDGTGVKTAVEAGGKFEPDMLGVGAENPKSPWGLLNNIHKAADEAFSQTFDISRLQVRTACDWIWMKFLTKFARSELSFLSWIQGSQREKKTISF